MARNKGTFQFSANFEVKTAEALDPRVVVSTKSDLINKDTWPGDGEIIYLYKGILVSVQDEDSVYMLKDYTKILESDYSGWKKVNTEIEVVDNLTSEDKDKALSAYQGKILSDKIEKGLNTLLSWEQF